MFTLKLYIHGDGSSFKVIYLIAEKMMVFKSLYMARSLYKFKGIAWFTQIT